MIEGCFRTKLPVLFKRPLKMHYDARQVKSSEEDPSKTQLS